jgi:hypothetical protein
MSKKSTKKKSRTVSYERPQSQSDKAREKAEAAKSKQLDKAGTALLDGKPDKTKKIMEKKPKPLTSAQRDAVLEEARTDAHRLRLLSIEIASKSEHLKELRAEENRLELKLRTDLLEADQGRLGFKEVHPGTERATVGKDTKKDKGKADAKPAVGEVSVGQVIDELDRELSGGSDLDEAAKLGEQAGTKGPRAMAAAGA